MKRHSDLNKNSKIYKLKPQKGKLKELSKLLKSSFMYVTYCELCPLFSIISENVLDVCKALQVMSFSPNSVNFCG
ncbi:hypothetical protein Hanom_Chr13g01238751 [Helianthus anomalus]